MFLTTNWESMVKGTNIWSFSAKVSSPIKSSPLRWRVNWIANWVTFDQERDL